MKSLYLILILLCISLNLPYKANGQEYKAMPTSQALWKIARCWSFYPGGWYDEYSIEMDGADTLINGRSYKKLNLVTHHLPGTQFDSVYTNFLGGMREVNKQVFFISEYLCIDTIERMVYDFNTVEPGDTIHTQVLTNGLTQFIPHIVTSIDDVSVNGENRRRINLRDEDGNHVESWIEGIGSNLGLTYASYWLLTDNSYDLICFYEGAGPDYINTSPAFSFCLPPLPNIECDSISSGIQDLPFQEEFTIYPNPALDFIQISTHVPFRQIDLFNYMGEVLFSFSPDEAMDIRSLASGMYYIRITDNTGRTLALHKLTKL